MAKQSQLNSLMDSFLEAVRKLVEEGRTALDKDGEIVTLTPDAASLNVVRQFLKDHGVEVDPDENEEMNRIRDALPFALDDEPESAQL